MVQEITPDWMKTRIDDSNAGAAENRNRYPIQEQATQQEIWDFVPCTCNTSCTCKKLGCTHHWKLKKGVGFDQFRNGFLRMFVSKNHHRAVIDAIEGRGTGNLTSRSIWAYLVLKDLQKNWPSISEAAAGHNKTLFCDDWLPVALRERMTFPVEGTSVYKAKQFSVLFPDIAVPYDTASRAKMLGFFGLSGMNYPEFLTVIRNSFMNSMTRHELTIPALRRLDNPGTRLPFDPTQVSLPSSGLNYGSDYSPRERTVSLVLDKCFYNPKTAAAGVKNTGEDHAVGIIHTEENENKEPAYVISPLSGHGEQLTVYRYPSYRKIRWGKLKFRVSDEMIRIILEWFFTEPGQWYQLGASMTDPPLSGLGTFIRKSFPSFTPRHASAVAAVLVKEGFVVARGKKPIELMKVVGRM